MKNSKKLLFTAMSACLLLSACGEKKVPDVPDVPDEGEKKEPVRDKKFVPGNYTYRTWSSSLGDNWNPFSWETNADNSMLGYVSTPFVDMAPLDTKEQTFQWVYDMATEVKDVTADCAGDFAKYHVAYSGNAVPTEQFVYQISLNPNAKWENGDPIKADDYIESAKLLLSPEYKHYRANTYYSGESAVAGGNQYFNSDLEGIYNPVTFPDIASATAENASNTVYIDVWDFWGAKGYTKFGDDTVACPRWVPINDETVYAKPGSTDVQAKESDAFSAKALLENYGAYFSSMTLAQYEINWGYQKTYEETVGIYKVDDYKINYVLQTALDWNYFMTSLTSTWLVKVDEFVARSKVDAKTGLKVADYGNSAANTFSYGPYKLASFEEGKQVVFEQNPAWYGWNKVVEADGKTYYMSETDFLVNGEKQQQYQTTKYVIDVLTQSTAKLMFEKGLLNDYTPTAQEVKDYSMSTQIYKVDETYTMSLFFCTNEEKLAAMDQEGNKNSIALSNHDFREAFSLAIDRAEWVKTTEGYKPAFALMNSLYYYDIYNDPSSQYRKTEQAMKAIVELYGVEYGDGKEFATLKEAYDSITGYNLSKAKTLMKSAYDKLSQDGKLNGTEIVIKVAYKKGALEDDDLAQVKKLNEFLSAAIEGSGFTKITLQAVGNLSDRYGAVGQEGTYAIGYGAWGGAAFYPFRNLDVYMDPESYDLHEGLCWDPTTEKLTLKVKGQDVTMTYQNWSKSLTGGGQFANEDFDTKLDILSALEKQFLGFYYRIPLAGSTSCFLLGYQQKYFTNEYQIMYGFGGARLMKYSFDDAEWADYINEKGTLNYK